MPCLARFSPLCRFDWLFQSTTTCVADSNYHTPTSGSNHCDEMTFVYGQYHTSLTFLKGLCTLSGRTACSCMIWFAGLVFLPPAKGMPQCSLACASGTSHKLD